MRMLTFFLAGFFTCWGHSRTTLGAQVCGEKTEVSRSARTRLKEYRNRNYNFAFKYPATWKLHEGFDGNGVSVYPHQDSSPFRTAIGVGGSVGQPSDTHEARARSLEEDFDSLLKAMREGPFGERNVGVIEQRHATIQGLPAITSTIEFDAGNPNQHYVLTEILIHTHDNAVNYHLSLTCRPEELQAMSKVFDTVVNTFRILGPPS